MAGALRLVSVQRGHDPRDFALVAYGGAGPLHANAVAKLMGSYPVIVPPAPGLLCAIGDLVADFRDEFAQTHIRLVAEASGEEVADILDGLGSRAKAWLDGEGIDGGKQRLSYVADMRYHRQGYEIPVVARAGRGRAPVGSAGSRSASTPSTSSCTASACRAPRPRSSTCAPSASAPCRSPSYAPARSAAPTRPAAVVAEHEVIFDGTKRSDEDLRPGEARARSRDRRARDRDGVRLHHRDPPGPRRHGGPNYNILITPSA